MLDSTPLKFAPPAGRNEILNELIEARLNRFRQTLRGERGNAKTAHAPTTDETALDLIAVWDSSLHALCDAVELVSDWGPFELVDMKAIYTYDGRRVICRFDYHGAPCERDQFEASLRDSLKSITRWEDAPAEGLVADKAAQS